MKKQNLDLQVIGWREWVGLPSLGVTSIKAKIDTGATTSSLHAFHIERFRRGNLEYVRFSIHPRQRNSSVEIQAEAPLIDVRQVRSSNGQLSERPVIAANIQLFGQIWPVELTLANRDQMGFRMLLGRRALKNRFLVDSARSYCNTTPKKVAKKSLR